MYANRVHARVGLLGNPSDGYGGKTISFSLQNFWAEVGIIPADKISFITHPQHDSLTYDSMEQLQNKICSCGFYGGVRLLQAMCFKFVEWCKQHAVHLESKNFAMSYDTNIPRQLGLAGSSAIVCAALTCLLQFYGVASQVPLELRPELMLSAEQELGIAAGPQDRVIQVYGGLVYMDFSKEHVSQHGHGLYCPLDTRLLPPLHLMYAQEPSDSGKVHSTVRQRWLAGDAEVQSLMCKVAECAAHGRDTLEKGDHSTLASLMNRNFALRRQLFGDAALGATNLRMVELAQSVGAAAKFTGSGGAVVVYCPDGDQQVAELTRRCEQQHFVLVAAQVAPPTPEAVAAADA